MSGGLGKLVKVYGVAPGILQRAVFIAVLSFLFFLSMMIVYYVRDSPLFFILATAFLLVYLVTMFSIFSQRRGVVQVFERGLEFKKSRLAWEDIESVSDGGQLALANRKSLNLPRSLDKFDELMAVVRSRTSRS